MISSRNNWNTIKVKKDEATLLLGRPALLKQSPLSVVSGELKYIREIEPINVTSLVPP